MISITIFGNLIALGGHMALVNKTDVHLFKVKSNF